jgi:hypothetical protein
MDWKESTVIILLLELNNFLFCEIDKYRMKCYKKKLSLQRRFRTRKKINIENKHIFIYLFCNKLYNSHSIYQQLVD